jgi:hypothetical protein
VRELRDYYQYLAAKYQHQLNNNLNSHTVDPVAGEIVPINNKDKVYFVQSTFSSCNFGDILLISWVVVVVMHVAKTWPTD